MTKPGLGLDVGAPAVNPIPRKNITEMVEEELQARAVPGAVVTLSVPGGEEMAKQTLNARLGLIGGISILGTSGIVKPYSTAAYKASIIQAIDVARERGQKILVVTTGGKSEAYAMKLHPALPEDAFIQMGDFVGITLKHCARARHRARGHRGHDRQAVEDGRRQDADPRRRLRGQHGAAGGVRRRAGRGRAVLAEIRAANTARHVLELCAREGLTGIASLICQQGRRPRRRAAPASPAPSWRSRHLLVDFDGKLLGRFPPEEIHAMTDMRQMTALGRSIEDGSFAIIDHEAGPHRFPPGEWQVVRRVIHATADFEYKSLMHFSDGAIAAGIRALRARLPGARRRAHDRRRA